MLYFPLYHPVLREQKWRLCSNTTCNFTVNKPGFKISTFASLRLNCLCDNCISIWAPGSRRFFLLCAEQTAATGDGVSPSDPPYLLYHLCTACLIVAAFFFLYSMCHSNPPSNQRFIFQERKGGTWFGTGWCSPTHLAHTFSPSYFLEAQQNMLSFLSCQR